MIFYHLSLIYCVQLVKDQSSFYKIRSLAIGTKTEALNWVTRKQLNILKTFLEHLEFYIAAWFNLKLEAVTRRCSVKEVLLEISQNSQENTCARVSFLKKKTLLKTRLWLRCFPANFEKSLRTPVLIEHPRWLLLLCVVYQITFRGLVAYKPAAYKYVKSYFYNIFFAVIIFSILISIYLFITPVSCSNHSFNW